MTTLVTDAPPTLPEDAGPGPADTARLGWVDHAAVLLLLVVWAVPLTRGVGGRSAHQLLIFTGVAIVASVALRPWRAGIRSLVVPVAVAAAAVVVCATSATGWSGADVAAGYVGAALSFVAIRTYVVSSRRREAVLCGVVLASLLQFGDAFLPWWGGRDPAQEMTGTFYWHNPYAAFLVPGALLGAAFVVDGRRPWRLAGWVAAPASVAGIVFSSSRATLAVVVVGWLLVAALCIRSRRSALRLAALTAATVAVVVVLPGPPFFPHRASPLAATSARTQAGQSLEQNGIYRTEFWREAVAVAEHHPVAGAGFHSLATDSALYTPAGWARSQLAHDGYLQPLTDGGLLLGLPFLLGAALVAWQALRRVAGAARRRQEAAKAVPVGAAVTVLALMAHSAVDFDWSHPSLLIQLALLAGCIGALRPPPASAEQRQPARARSVAIAATAALAAVGVVTVVALQAWERTADAVDSRLSARARLAAAAAPFGDYRAAVSVLRTSLVAPARVNDSQASRALNLTARAATGDVHLALLRDAVRAQRGQGDAAVASARHLLARLHGVSAPYVLDLSGVLAAAGDRIQAETLLTEELQRQAADGATPDAAAEAALLAQLEAGASRH